MLVRNRWRASALCASAALLVIGLASPAFSTTAVDLQANNPQVSGDPTSDTTAVFPTNKQNEPTIAVNPVDSRYLISGSNDEQRQPPCGPGPVRGTVPANDCSFFPNVGTSGIYTSSDGGVSWTNRGLLDDQQAWQAGSLVSDGDPVIMYGPKPDPSAPKGFSYRTGARAYYSTLASYKNNAGKYPPNKAPEYLAVSYSDDNGLTWSAPALATTKNNPNDFNDKEWLATDADPASPFFGRVYVSWTEFRAAGTSEPIMVTISTDGAATFGSPNQLSPAGNNGTGNGRQGSYVITGPDGSVYVAFEQGNSQVVAISRDGGKGWSRPITIGPVDDIPDPLPGANFRTDSFPTIAADPRAGATTLYASWSTEISGGTRIVTSTSTNKGLTWSAPLTVSTAAEGYAFFQGMDVAPNGRVDLAYQAQRAINPNTYGTGNAAIDSWYVGKPSAGSPWSAPTKISSASSDPAVSAQNNLVRQFFGDYNHLVSTNATAWFIYTDSRDGVGCPSVDAYQHFVDGTATVRGDMRDRIDRRLGREPFLEPGEKPAPLVDCPAQFGNTDPFVSRITP
jgi:hypothetical protein